MKSNRRSEARNLVMEPDHEESSQLEPIQSEIDDHEAALPSYEILTYPADYTLEVLVDKWKKGDIAIPKFQRHFVWNQNQASKLIDSFLRGLPVPSIFLFQSLADNKLLVVDGQQRLRTIAYFFEGYFGEERAGKRATFSLTGLEQNSPFSGLTYESLRDREPATFAKLNDSVLRSFVMRQLHPDDDTSIYHVFERLNTGGTLLRPQEIRNCIHHGPFNDMLIDLNRLDSWREIYGINSPDKRQRDVELILRFLALYSSSSSYEKPMKDFLNKFMARHRSASEDKLASFGSVFSKTVEVVSQSLGWRPFHIRIGLNAAVLDAVLIAVARHLDNLPTDFKDRFQSLIRDDEFLACVTSGTTDEEVIARRMELASRALG